MQDLLSRAASIPHLLQQFDALQDNTTMPQQNSIQSLCVSFMELCRNLQDWEALHNGGFTIQTFDPANCAIAPSAYVSTRSLAQADKSLLFNDISSANGLTHCWAFQIICLLHYYTLKETIQQTFEDSLGLCVAFHEEVTITMALNILQSMDYLIQDKMHLYGQASTFFPLKVAHRVFKAQKPPADHHVHQCELVVERLVSKGLVMAATYLD